jgi:phage shock protein PspC (stress-responsive transcriptional regulator)
MEYINREQYGNRPLLYGSYYNAPEKRRIETTPSYAKLNGRYEIVQRSVKVEYDSRFCTFFPRMYSADPSHVKMYQSWGNIKGRPVRVVQEDGKTVNVYCPTFFENLRFFFSYQLGHMYWRYFMWNFAGRQNDVQADDSILNGNWFSGIPFIDIPRIGPQDNLPPHLKNDAGRNRYFMLPLILGMIGLLWQLQRDVKYFWVVMALFFMTGIAIVIYLNQTPLQPRERDYAYAGSFYAFAIWIGLGVAAVYDLLRRKIPAKPAAAAACLLSLTVPVIMAQQNWRDHNRSGRYTARDIAYNYLNSCAPNAILFTVGDNDTYPLWYLQEVEGVRTDVRVVNLQLLRADWYISQMKMTAYDSPPLPVMLPEEKYLRGRRDVIYVVSRYQDTIPLQSALEFIRSDDPRTKWIIEPGMELDYIMCRNFSLPVDRQKVLSNGTVNPKDAGLLLDTLPFRISSSVITKEQWILLEILAANNWERPVYWTSCKHDGTIGLDDYLQLEGTAYRLVPLKTPAESLLDVGRIDSDILYDRLMNIFRWEGINNPKVWLDNQNLRTLSVVRARHIYTRLAKQLIAEDKSESAAEVLQRAMELFPASRTGYDYYSILQAEALYQAELTDLANAELTGYADQLIAELDYFYALPPVFFGSVQQKSEMNVELLRLIMDISDAYDQQQIGNHIQQRLERRD